MICFWCEHTVRSHTHRSLEFYFIIQIWCNGSDFFIDVRIVCGSYIVHNNILPILLLIHSNFIRNIILLRPRQCGWNLYVGNMPLLLGCTKLIIVAHRNDWPLNSPLRIVCKRRIYIYFILHSFILFPATRRCALQMYDTICTMCLLACSCGSRHQCQSLGPFLRNALRESHPLYSCTGPNMEHQFAKAFLHNSPCHAMPCNDFQVKEKQNNNESPHQRFSSYILFFCSCLFCLFIAPANCFVHSSTSNKQRRRKQQQHQHEQNHLALSDA